MNVRLVGALSVGLAAGRNAALLTGQSRPDTVEAHVAAARAAAGEQYTRLFDNLCEPGFRLPPAPADAARERSRWHAEPAKVFDNLYFLGQSESSWPGAPSAWAVTTSGGLILIDTLFDYSVEDEIVGGLKTLGLDPRLIKYAVVSHGHYDHSGGARYLQDHFGTRAILSAADWDWLDGNPASQPRPARDLVATDGQQLQLGDTTVTLYVTPGHTPGTISALVPVRDGGKPHLAAIWGGTGFNWVANPSPAVRARYITPEKSDTFWFETYGTSARRFREIAARAGADVLIANHSVFDGTWTKLPRLMPRKPGDPHPFVVGVDGVVRYLTVAEECARAGLLRTR
jgi:metallo-beta-lactamase class B